MHLEPATMRVDLPWRDTKTTNIYIQDSDTLSNTVTPAGDSGLTGGGFSFPMIIFGYF